MAQNVGTMCVQNQTQTKTKRGEIAGNIWTEIQAKESESFYT